MNRSKASEHYRNLVEMYGTAEERRTVPRSLGFARPSSDRPEGPYGQPTGVSQQTWENWWAE